MLTKIKFIFSFEFLSTVLIFLILYYFVTYIRNIYIYPRGPFPLPFLGNVLSLRGDWYDPSPIYKLMNWAQKYGPIYTLWIGPTPLVVVNTYELHKEAAIQRKNDFITRPDTIMHAILRDGSEDIFSTNGPQWEVLRKIGFTAIRKFAISDTLPVMINDVMDESIGLMLEQKQPINPIIYIDFMIYNIIALTAYGDRFESIQDKDFLEAKRVNDDYYEVAGNGLVSDYIPWLRPLYYISELKIRDMVKASVEVTKKSFMENKKTYTPGKFRNLSDCLLAAKEEAIDENQPRSQYLNDTNVFMVISDLFQAGTDTTQTFMRWALLMLANDPIIQDRIYTEITANIGHRCPTQEDRDVLPFTYAFVLEVLRYRPPAPIGVDHTNPDESQIGGHIIPKNSIVVFNIYAENNDPKYWSQPEQFDPNRFLDINGQLVSGRVPSFVTFGLGRRGCPGEKLALFNMFIMIARLVQTVRVVLSTGALTANVIPLNVLIGSFPRDYQIYCTKR